MKKYVALFTLCAFAAIPGFAFAQFGGFSDYATSVTEADVDLVITPDSPGPFQMVRMKLESNTIDLNRYSIRWSVNGKQQLAGIGERVLQTQTGGYGSSTAVSIFIDLEYKTLQKSIILSPQDATVLWEAIDATVPPFYRGKKLAGSESLIKVSAIPNFQSLNSLKMNDAVYLWDRNGNRILGVGGYAKDSIIIKQNRLRSAESISVTVSNVANTIQVVKNIVIPIANPEIHWYARDEFNYRPLVAVNQGLRIQSGNVNLIAEPYFFSVQRNAGELTYTWNMNNDELYLNPDAPRQELLVRNPETAGQVNFRISVENPATFLQKSTNSIPLYFLAPKN